MTLYRWLSVAMLTLATTGALHAQTASFSVLGLSTLFGGDVEELPAPQRCELNMLPVFVSECLTRWQEQWNLGNFKEAEKLANIASRLDPTNPKVQHAQVLSEIVQILGENQGSTMFGEGFNSDAGIVGSIHSCKEASCYAATGAANTCQTAACTSKACCIEQRLREPIGCISFRDTPLHQVIDDMRTLSGINIVPDYRALQEADISLDTPVNLSLQKLSLKTVLNLIADQIKLACIVENQVVLITTPEKARGGNRLVTYPVADLVAAPTPTLLENTLITLIQNTVAADTWKDVGGQGTIQFYPLGKALVVNQTQDVQEEVAELLNALRGMKENIAGEGGCLCPDSCPCPGSCPCPAFGHNLSQFQGVKAITGLTPAGTLTTELAIPITRNGFDFQVPPFGGYPGVLSADGNFSMIVLNEKNLNFVQPINQFAGVYLHPLQGMPMPPPARGLGVVTSLPTPAQAMHDLEFVRQAAFENARACACVNGTCTVAQPMPPAPKHNVHLVTPQMEVHCERLTSVADADHILLEGDVELTCQRDGQTIRIQGQRVRVNLSQGTFTVESTPETHSSESRVRGVSFQGTHVQPATYTAPVMPTRQLYYPVAPAPYTPEYNRFKPVE